MLTINAKQACMVLLTLLLLLRPTTGWADLDRDQLAYEMGCPQVVEMRDRVLKFLQRHKTKAPNAHLQVILDQCKDAEEIKRWAAMLVIESNGNRHLHNKAGAKGSWGVREKVWPDLAKGHNLYDPATNLRLARFIFRYHLEQTGKVWGYRGAEWCYSGGSNWYPDEVRKMMKEI